MQFRSPPLWPSHLAGLAAQGVQPHHRDRLCHEPHGHPSGLLVPAHLVGRQPKGPALLPVLAHRGRRAALAFLELPAAQEERAHPEVLVVLACLASREILAVQLLAVLVGLAGRALHRLADLVVPVVLAVQILAVLVPVSALAQVQALASASVVPVVLVWFLQAGSPPRTLRGV